MLEEQVLDTLQMPPFKIAVHPLIRQRFIIGVSHPAMIDTERDVICRLVPLTSVVQYPGVSENILTIGFIDCRNPTVQVARYYVMISGRGVVYPAPGVESTLKNLAEYINKQLLSSPYRCLVVTATSTQLLARGNHKRLAASYTFNDQLSYVGPQTPARRRSVRSMSPGY